ncbi:hypothetical protein P7C70_g7633, partial [Phenoliferia sp. Uapishka_3]
MREGGSGPRAIQKKLKRANEGRLRKRQWVADDWELAMIQSLTNGARSNCLGVHLQLPKRRCLRGYVNERAFVSSRGYPIGKEMEYNLSQFGMDYPKTGAPEWKSPIEVERLRLAAYRQALVLHPPAPLPLVPPLPPSPPPPPPLIRSSPSVLTTRDSTSSTTPLSRPNAYANPSRLFSPLLSSTSSELLVPFIYITDEISAKPEPCFDATANEVRAEARETFDQSRTLTIDTPEEQDAIVPYLDSLQGQYYSEITTGGLTYPGSPLLPFLWSGTNKKRRPADETRFIGDVIKSIRRMLPSVNGWLTTLVFDGDPVRRSGCYSLTLSEVINEEHPLYQFVGNLVGFRLLVGADSLTVFMEGRHRHKRKGTLLRRKTGVVVFGVKLAPTGTIGIMSRQDPSRDLAFWTQLLYPHDRQNFSKQVKLERRLIDIQPPTSSDSYLLAQGIHAARFWGRICEASLDPFIRPDMSIGESIRSELKAAFLIFSLRWSGGQQSIGWELFVDTMSSAMSNIVTAAKLKLISPHAKFKVRWHDGEEIEKYYGVNRELSSDAGVSLESMPRNAARIYQVQQIERKHPGWRERDPRLDWSQDSTADKAPTRAFVGEEEVGSFSIEEEWYGVMEDAQAEIDLNPLSRGKINLLEVLSQPGVHLLNPDGKGHVGAGAFFGTGPDEGSSEDIDETVHPVATPSPEEVLNGAISAELGLASAPLSSQTSPSTAAPPPLISTPIQPTNFYSSSSHSSGLVSLQTPRPPLPTDSDTRESNDAEEGSEEEELNPQEFPPPLQLPTQSHNPYPRHSPLTTLANGRPCAKSKFLADYKYNHLTHKKVNDRIGRNQGFIIGTNKTITSLSAFTEGARLASTCVPGSLNINESFVVFDLKVGNTPTFAIACFLSILANQSIITSVAPDMICSPTVTYEVRVLALERTEEDDGWRWNGCFIDFGAIVGKGLWISGSSFTPIRPRPLPPLTSESPAPNQPSFIRFDEFSDDDIELARQQYRLPFLRVVSPCEGFPYPRLSDPDEPVSLEQGHPEDPPQALTQKKKRAKKGAASANAIYTPCPACRALLNLGDGEGRHHLSLHHWDRELKRRTDGSEGGQLIEWPPGTVELGAHTCGWCGGDGCSTQLGKTSNHTAPAFRKELCALGPPKPPSYAWASKSTANAPSSDVIHACTRCEAKGIKGVWLWDHELSSHYSQLHSNLQRSDWSELETRLFTLSTSEKDHLLAWERKRRKREAQRPGLA